jgi:hypothetical protein
MPITILHIALIKAYCGLGQWLLNSHVIGMARPQ